MGSEMCIRDRFSRAQSSPEAIIYRAMLFSEREFQQLLADGSKCIRADIVWIDDEDHSPAVEFRAEVENEAGYDLFVHGSFNRLARTLTYCLVLRTVGRIYALDLGKAHHNPDCQQVGEVHKHYWTERHRDRMAYEPGQITASVEQPGELWRQFCLQARIRHDGHFAKPPPYQAELFE